MDSVKNTTLKPFNRIGLALFSTAALTSGLQALFLLLPEYLSSSIEPFWRSSWYTWLMTFVPLYVIGIPVGIWIMKKVPCDHREPITLGGKNFFLFMLMCFPIMYGGNLIGTLLSSLLSGGNATNGLFSYAFDDNPLKIVVMVILAPLLEEYLFRKQLIDRTARYGEKTAILFSALAFGLFHMNLYQFFYAFGLGLLFGYVYLRTRRLRYSVIMHMVINGLSSVIVPLLLSKVGTDTFVQMAAGQYDEAALIAILPDMVGFILYAVVILGLSVAGLVVLIVKAPKLVYLPSSEEIPKRERFKAVYCNIGVILFIIFCLVFFVLNLIR